MKERDYSDRNSYGAPFPQTSWSMIQAASGSTGSEEDEKVKRAMADFCQLYWEPLYAFIRRNGYQRADAEDLTQEFLAKILAKESLAGTASEKGKLRTFLLTLLKRFIIDHRRQASALKRGGNVSVVSIDITEGEFGYAGMAAEELTPETVFDRRWASVLLNRVQNQLRDEYARSEKEKLYDTLCPYLEKGSGEVSYARAGEALGLKEGTVKVAVFRLRKRYRKLLHEEIRETVSTPEEVDHEIEHLFSAFA